MDKDQINKEEKAMEHLELDYYYGIEAEQYSFFRIPRLLIKDERYKDLSSDAVILFGLMLDRMSLSRKNGWFDSQNRAYIHYTGEDAESDLGKSRGTVIKVMNMLVEIGLIERKKPGQGKPAVIYVKNFATLPAGDDDKNEHEDSKNDVPESEVQNLDFQKSKNWTSRSLKTEFQEVQKLDFKESKNYTSRNPETELQEVQKLHPNYNDMNYTENSYTEKSHISHSVINCPDSSVTEDSFDDDGGDDPIALQANCLEMIKSRVDYPSLAESIPDDMELVDELIRIMVNVVCFGEGEYNINHCKVPVKVIADQFAHMDKDQLMAAVNALKNTTSKLSSPEAYMVATLYSARNKTLSRTVQQNNLSLGNFDKTVPEQEERTDYDALVAMLKKGDVRRSRDKDKFSLN